jgi:hypothetical protein
MPFGTPTDMNLSIMKSFLTAKDIGWSPKYRVSSYCFFIVSKVQVNINQSVYFQLSAWRPMVGSKTRNQLHFAIQEQVNAAIYNDSEKTVFKDMCRVFGTISCKVVVVSLQPFSQYPKARSSKTPIVGYSLVFHYSIHMCVCRLKIWIFSACTDNVHTHVRTCNVSLFKADIEGVPEVSLNLSSKSNINFTFHPCLQWVDIASTGRSGSLGNSSPDLYQSLEHVPISRSVCFTPPHEVFPFCHMNGDSRLPVKGIYQRKTEVGDLENN